MQHLFPIPFLEFLRISYQNGGYSWKGLKNIPPWLLKTILLEPLRWTELIAWKNRVENYTIPHAPVFILGYYRSGTTYLQQVLLQDDRFGHHTVFQMVFPEMMLTSERWMSPFMQHVANLFKMDDPVHRIPLTWDFPGEEDGTMTTSLNPEGAQWGFFFPEKMEEYFNRYVLFNDITEQDKASWVNSFQFLLKKISIAAGDKPLVLKSPPHTARVKLLLELFPRARFILIHRNPYEVFVSNQRFWEVANDIYTIGRTKNADLSSIILHTYSKMMDRYLAEREYVPAGQLMEVRYSEFIADPMQHMRSIYEVFELGDFQYCENKMAAFTAKQANFTRLKHSVDSQTICLVSQAWERYIREWGYSLL